MTSTEGQATNHPNLLVVLGATGNQGNAVLKHFAALRSELRFRLRGVTRNTESTNAKELQALGIEIVEGDINNLATLQSCFKSATHIFATTDSNRLIFDAIERPQLLSEGQTPRDYARGIELAQGRNICEAAASTESLQRIIWSSLPSPKKWSKGRYTKVSMFDTKEDIADMLGANPSIKDKLSVLLIGFYATNPLHVPHLYGPQKQAENTYELSLPMSGDIRVPIADLQSDMGKWISALLQADPGVVLVGATESLSWKEWLDMWARRNSVEARFRRASSSEYGDRIQGISDAVLEEFEFVENFGFTGGNPQAVYPEEVLLSAHIL